MDLASQQFLRDLGFRLREHRTARSWSQAELAKRCGLHRTFIGSAERGERNLSILNLRRIARAMRLPLAELLVDLT